MTDRNSCIFCLQIVFYRLHILLDTLICVCPLRVGQCILPAACVTGYGVSFSYIVVFVVSHRCRSFEHNQNLMATLLFISVVYHNPILTEQCSGRYKLLRKMKCVSLTVTSFRRCCVVDIPKLLVQSEISNDLIFL